jgi:hypothetical protein
MPTISLYLGIIAVKPLPDHCLLLTFENSERRIFDMKPYLLKGVFSELSDESIFATVKVHFDSIEWSNGADLDPEMLYNESKPAGKTPVKMNA